MLTLARPTVEINQTDVYCDLSNQSLNNELNYFYVTSVLFLGDHYWKHTRVSLEFIVKMMGKKK